MSKYFFKKTKSMRKILFAIENQDIKFIQDINITGRKNFCHHYIFFSKLSQQIIDLSNRTIEKDIEIFNDWYFNCEKKKNIMSFRDFILKDQNSEEIRSILNNLREIILEIKPGKKYLLKLTNKLTPAKFWFSSTNDPDEREANLSNLIKNHS